MLLMFHGVVARSYVLVYCPRLRFKQEGEWPSQHTQKIVVKRQEFEGQMDLLARKL